MQKASLPALSPAFFALATLLVLLGSACSDGGAPALDDTVLGHCDYTNRFADQPECREFRGEGWSEDEAKASCDEEGAPFEEGPCGIDAYFGTCVVVVDDTKQLAYVSPGDDPAACSEQQRACELFAGGSFVDGPTCGGETGVDEDDLYSEDYVMPAERICVEPSDDEQPGESEGGQVCTWQQMSGCTEEGRLFEEYASCDAVRTQRPYYPIPPSDEGTPVVDERMQDAAYAGEVAWVKSQLEACACVCCHKTSATPSGASIYDTEVGQGVTNGNFVSSFSDWGIAFAARAFDSSLLGSYAPEENNGFGRTISGLPSTDEERMRAFFLGELAYRGRTVDEFASLGPQPAIFASQAAYEPGPCTEGEGVSSDGTVTWKGGRARYVFVLDEGSANPGVPPNLDEPAGLRFKLDTIPPAIPMKTGEVTYGSVPEGAFQAFPDDGAPLPLTPGETYYVVALADIAVPITRCTFTYE